MHGATIKKKYWVTFIVHT